MLSTSTVRNPALSCRPHRRHSLAPRPPQAPGPTCPAHALLTRQATLDHLLFVYRTRTRFVAREFQPD